MRLLRSKARSFGALICLSGVAATPACAGDFVQDFRNKQCDGRAFSPLSEMAMNYVRPENDGLRIKVPESLTTIDRAGMRFLLNLEGDFSTTLAFDVLEASIRDASGLELLLQEMGNDALGFCSISRGMRSGSGVYVARARFRGSPDVVDFSTQQNVSGATQVKSGRLRIERTGRTVRLSAADGDAGEFRSLLEIKDAGLRYRATIFVNVKETPDGIDLRLTRFAAEGGVDSSSLATGSATPLGGGFKPRRSMAWLRWPAMIGVLVAAAACGLWLLKRFQSERELAPATHATTHLPRERSQEVNADLRTQQQASSSATSARAENALKELMQHERANRPASQGRPTPAAPPDGPRARMAPTAPPAAPASHVERTVPASPEPPLIPRRESPPPANLATAVSPVPTTRKPEREPAAERADSALATELAGSISFNEAALAALEAKAHDYLANNPFAVSYGERNHFRFHFHGGKIHGPLVAWWEMDPEAIKRMGVKGKEIEDRLPKKFEGNYEAGSRHGTFCYWDEAGRSLSVTYRDGSLIPAAEQAVAPEQSTTIEPPVVTGPSRPFTAVESTVAHVDAPPEVRTGDNLWDENSLAELEKKAREFLSFNPGAVSYGERHRFRFHFQHDKLHGPFVAWWESDIEKLKAIGIKGKEIEDRLPKKFEGCYADGVRHGTFVYWTAQEQAVVVCFEHGQIVSARAASVLA